MEQDDFWRAGETGPCGPTVRILFYLSDGETTPTSVSNLNDDRFAEIWHLVFVQVILLFFCYGYDRLLMRLGILTCFFFNF